MQAIFFKQSIDSNCKFSLVHLSISQSFLFIPEIKHYIAVIQQDVRLVKGRAVTNT